MYSYFYGKVVSLNKKTITFDCQSKGYIVNVINPNEFKLNEKIFLYVYNQLISNNAKNFMLEELYGFKQYQQKEMFLLLMRCVGIGPKTAISICKNDTNLLKQFISSKDYNNLSKCHSITPKLSKVIIDTLSEYFSQRFPEKIDKKENQIFSALDALGYEKNDILFALCEIEKMKIENAKLPDLISKAIKIILNKNQIHNNEPIHQ